MDFLFTYPSTKDKYFHSMRGPGTVVQYDAVCSQARGSSAPSPDRCLIELSPDLGQIPRRKISASQGDIRQMDCETERIAVGVTLAAANDYCTGATHGDLLYFSPICCARDPRRHSWGFDSGSASGVEPGRRGGTPDGRRGSSHSGGISSLAILLRGAGCGGIGNRSDLDSEAWSARYFETADELLCRV
jgi:hypothetical protein